MSTLDLIPFSIVRPHKVRWVVKLFEDQPVESVFRSKSIKKMYLQIDQIVNENQLTVSKRQMDKSGFEQWLSFYRLKSQEYGYQQLATPEWFELKMREQKKVEIIEIYQGQRILSSGIVTKKMNTAALAFSASERVRISSLSNSSLGGLLNCLFIRMMVQEGIDEISGGRSRNAFGVANTFGYLEYKLRFGYTPEADLQSDQTEFVPLNQEGAVMFFGIDKKNLFGLYACKPKESELSFPVLPTIQGVAVHHLSY